MAAEAIVFVFRLFVAGQSERSQAAEANLRALCDDHLAGRYKLEVIDTVQRPDLAEVERILATPMVVRLAPLPPRRVIGDLSHHRRAAAALGIPIPGDPPSERTTP